MTYQVLRLTTFGAVVMLAFSLPAFAADGVVQKDEVDRLVQPLIDGEWSAGLVVGVIDADGRRVYGYGRGAGAEAKAPDGDTVYEIGSATKAFTGLLLAEMVGRGEVKLDDPVQKYLPDGVTLPQVGEKPITLAHLASHSSGLPRMPDNFAPADANNPYADYTPEQMYAFLKGCKPQREPGAKTEYSNLGMGLLGHVLALRAGKSYEALLTERVLEPLGMRDTSIALTDAVRTRLAPGHDADGSPAGTWDLPTFAGAGALRSTANDMLKFLAANIVSEPGPLKGAIALSHVQPAAAGADGGVALGWHLSRKGGILWHNGQTGGYHSFCGFSRDGKVGVVVLANTATGIVDAVGNRLLKRMTGDKLEPIEVRQAVKLSEEVLDRRVGTYQLAPTFALTLSREGGQLYCQATGQPRFRVYPESETKFFFKVVDAQLTFKAEGEAKATSLVLHQNGMELPGARVEEAGAAKPAE